MKTYKINGKEIERINGGVIDFNGFKAENLTSTEMKINELLEALSDKEVTNSQDSYQEESRCKLKQEECRACRVENYGAEAINTKHTCTPKQSTSLKESIENIVDNYAVDIYENRFTATAKILKLIQSHLVKEIEKLEVQIVDDWTKEVGKQIGYSLNKGAIIKIIQNL